MRFRKIRERIGEIFVTTILFQIGLTLAAIACWFAVFHPLGQDLAMILLRNPYQQESESFTIIEWMIVIFAAGSASALAVYSWREYFIGLKKGMKEKRYPELRDELVRKIIEVENPDIDFEGADNRSVFREYDPVGRLQVMSLDELNNYLKEI